LNQLPCFGTHSEKMARNLGPAVLFLARLSPILPLHSVDRADLLPD
jgi:hypothetical protein